MILSVDICRPRGETGLETTGDRQCSSVDTLTTARELGKFWSVTCSTESLANFSIDLDNFFIKNNFHQTILMRSRMFSYKILENNSLKMSTCNRNDTSLLFFSVASTQRLPWGKPRRMWRSTTLLWVSWRNSTRRSPYWSTTYQGFSRGQKTFITVSFLWNLKQAKSPLFD